MDGRADLDRAAVGLLLAGDQLEQGGLAGAVGADHADDAAGRQREAQILEQQFVAIGLGDAVDLDDVAAEPLGHLDQDLRLARRAVLLRLDQLVEGADAGLGLGLARLGRAADPFQLVVDRLLLALLLALFLLQPLGFLLQIAGIIGFVDVIAAAIELEHPVHDIVEEVAVVGDEDDVAGIIDEMLFEPLHALGVEMVGRLVEQQDVGLLEQQPGQRHPALLAAGEIVDRGVAGRAAQRVHRDLELVVERPAVDRVDLLLKLAHFGHQRVEIGILGRIGHQRADRVEPVHHVGDRADAVHDVLLDRLGRIELRLLLEIADA